MLNRLETESPGTKQRFYWGFLDKQAKPDVPTESMTEKGPTHPRALRRLRTTDHRRHLHLLQDDGKAKSAMPR